MSMITITAERRVRPWRVVHAAENIKGGVGSYLRELLVLQKRSFGENMVTAVVPASQRDMLQAPTGIRIVPFDDGGTRLGNALRMASLARRVMSDVRPDVVHLHSTFAGAMLRAQLTVSRHGAAVVYCPHGWAFDRESSPWVVRGAQWIERGLAGLCDSIVCISEHERRLAVRCGIPMHKLALVRNGVPRIAPQPAGSDQTPPWPPGVRRLLFVGRFDRQKGVDVLFHALEQLDGECFAFIVGGSVLNDLELPAVPANARLVGWLSPAQMEAYYRSADVLVIPSRWEGFGLTAVEAMRSGLAVVASRVGGLQEIVEDGTTGALVPPGNVAALIRTLRGLSRERLREMGNEGRERFVRRYTMEQVHEQLLWLYSRSGHVAHAH
jgi:glycosyltransferase involved in cell wall biosynthesis